MRLYSLIGATAHHEPGGEVYVPDPDEGSSPFPGSFPFPDEVSDRLHPFAVNGRKLWESPEERTARLHSADLAARRDPETLYAAMAGMAGLTKALAERQLDPAPASAGGTPALPPEVSAELDALRRQVAELQAAAAAQAPAGSDGEPPADGEAAAAPSRSRKPPAAKGAAAG